MHATGPSILAGVVFAAVVSAIVAGGAPAREMAGRADRRASLDPVIVVLDMDPSAPGFQNDVNAPAGDGIVEGVGLYIHDPVGGRGLWAIGYLGGIDRGIAFGHVPANRNAGSVERIIPEAGTAVNPGNAVIFAIAPGLDPSFPGPEVQVLEAGAEAPSAIPITPLRPVCTFDIEIRNAAAGDVFDFYLLDHIRVWAGPGFGAFSTQAPLSLDTGGDAILDGTRSIHGVDPDSAVSVPPAAYFVDYVDGGGIRGPATITVRGVGGLDGDSLDGGSAGPALVCCPNPFAGKVRFRRASQASGPLRILIHDVEGRRIGTVAIAGGPGGPDPEAAGWDGRDRWGRPVPPGVYFLRIEGAGGRASIQRVVRGR